jgi:hypothetical protein
VALTPKLTPRQLADLHRAFKLGVGRNALARIFGLNPQTVGKYLSMPTPDLPSPGRRLVMRARQHPRHW